MPRTHIDAEPVIINSIQSEIAEKPKKSSKEKPVLLIGSGNQNKIKEYQRLFPDYKVEGKDLKIDEVQSLDAHEVARKKAKMGWEKNDYNPILIEDTSFEIAGLNGRPGTLADSFIKDPAMRKDICEVWLQNKDRRALARVILGLYDGVEYHLFEGTVSGTIAETPRGAIGFGFDDIFIPQGEKQTFAEMGPEKKDKFSMRAMAAKLFSEAKLNTARPVFQIPEPFHSELKRVRADKLLQQNSTQALKFAYSLECINPKTKPDKEFKNVEFAPIIEESNPYYLRYKHSNESASLGLILTDVDRTEIKKHKNGMPVLWQYGAEKLTLSLAQRVDYFNKNTSKEVIQKLNDLDSKDFPQRSNRRSSAIEELLYGIKGRHDPIYARAIPEVGYKKITSPKRVSRSNITELGIYSKVGKYSRACIGIGSMPAVSGWRDVIVAGALGHLPVFIPRNNILAENIELQLKLIEQSKNVLKDVIKDKKFYERVSGNIGVAIGTNNPKEELKKAIKLHDKAGINLFRIYTINGDPRCVETATLLRKELGKGIEIFAGQVTDKLQATKYVENAEVDALIFGHGGGRQCTSAANGMAISTIEEIYSITTDQAFNHVSLIAEGGVGSNIGPLLILGIDCILYNNRICRGGVETGGLYVQNEKGQLGQPYHGSASAPTMIIEAANPLLRDARLNPSGRTKVPEGKPGFMKYSAKVNSMAFWVDEYKYHAARTLADLGVESISEMRNFLQTTSSDLLRIVSAEASEKAAPYGTF